MPFEITTGSTKNFDSNGHNRPNLVSGVNAILDPHRPRAQVAAEWFNPEAFVANGPGVSGGIGPGGADGNTPRDYLRGPGYRDVDFGFFRDIHFAEKMTFQLRGESSHHLQSGKPQQPVRHERRSRQLPEGRQHPRASARSLRHRARV